jgi:FMN-binding domain
LNPRFLVLPAALVVCHSAQALVYLSVEQAQALMFPGRTLAPLPLVLSAADIAAIEKDSGVQVYAGSLTAWKADSGYFFTDSVIGKHDLIRYAVALDMDGKVREVEILEYREAYGGEVRNARWLHQFVGLQHGDTVKVGRGIQNISGATLSSGHLTDGIRRLLATYAIAIAGR